MARHLGVDVVTSGVLEPSEDDISTSELPSFDMSLAPVGDEGSSFRTRNDPSAPFQRSNYVERKGQSISGAPFRFDLRKNARRFTAVDILLEFRGINPGETGPEVYAISPPVGSLALVPTTQHEEVKHMAGVQLGSSAPIGGITATGSMSWEKTTSRDTTDQTTIVGSIDLRGRNWGKSNCASWTLLENKMTKTGVPRPCARQSS